jgi:hypothetical protein
MSSKVAVVPGIGRVEVIARLCHTDDCCPTVYATERRTYLVQGYVLHGGEAEQALGIPQGESIVEVPRELLLQLMAGQIESAPGT